MEKTEGIVMKNIEQRAKEYASKQGDIAIGTLYNAVLAIINNAYIAGAVEQKIIDEKIRLKKCDDMTEAEYDRETAFADWYFKNGKSTPTFSDAIEWSRKEMLDKVCNWLSDYLVCEHEILTKAGCESVINELRKALEE